MDKLFITALLIALTMPTAQAVSDRLKEERHAQQLAKQATNDTVVWLEAEGRFLALLQESYVDKPRGTVILIHGREANLVAPAIINPLRKQLTDWGWHTLSIQLPMVADDAPAGYLEPIIRETPARIAAAVQYLRDTEIDNIILLGHDMGATLAARYIIANGTDSPELAGFVGIGILGEPAGKELDILPLFAELTIPMLDIYGSHDEHSLPHAEQRNNAAIKHKLKDYRQVEHPGADHNFRGMQQALIHKVKSWLNSNPVEDSMNKSEEKP